MAIAVLLLLVLVACLLALTIFRIVGLLRLTVRQSRTIDALRYEIAVADLAVEAQSEIIEQQAFGRTRAPRREVMH